MKLKAVLTAALLLAPTAALAAPGIVTESAGLRAGPGPGFPLVDRIPGGSRVNVHGCLRGDAWCDVSWSDDRGWVSSQYLEYLYRNSYVYLPDYVDEIGVPIVPFVLSSYWSSYYPGRPWYHRRAYWNTYWSSHERAATRMTINRSAARIGRAATRNGMPRLPRDERRAPAWQSGPRASGTLLSSAAHERRVDVRLRPRPAWAASQVASHTRTALPGPARACSRPRREGMKRGAFPLRRPRVQCSMSRSRLSATVRR